MPTRMEKVAEDVALAAIRNASTAAAVLLPAEKLQESFRAAWPTGESRTPINDAMNAGVNATTAGVRPQDRETWKARMEDAWSKAVIETVTAYFQTARQSFEQGQPLEGVEILTDAVRATLGHIAAARAWPHSTRDDLYSIAAALASGNGWPEEMEAFDQALKDASPEGDNLCAALCASMGRPNMLKFGVYDGDPEGPERDSVLFATTTIELANRLANQKAETP